MTRGKARIAGVLRAGALAVFALFPLTCREAPTPGESVGRAAEPVTTPCTKDLAGVGQLASGWNGVRTDGSLWRPMNPANAADASQRDRAMGNDNVALADMDGEAVHQCALKANGDVWCWGSNAHGELGRGFASVQEEPAKVPGLPTAAKQLAVGIDGTCALLVDGSVWCWGSNEHGQLGNGMTSTLDRTAPAQVVALGTGNDAVTCGYWHSCALKAGAVSCWGYNDAYGSVGDGTWTPVVTTPEQVQTGVLQVSAGGWYTCAIKADHSLWCWGDNYWGELGLGDGSNRNVPTAVPSLGTTVDLVDTAVHATCAVVTGGLVRCWGSPENGRLGNGQLGTSPPVPAEAQRVPVPVSGPLGTVGGAVYLREGKASACAMTTSGRVYCWGGGGFIDGTGQTSVPVEIDFCGLPTLDSIAPASGPMAGGTVATLKGTEWKPGATVTFGPTMKGVSTMVPDPTTVTTTTPNHGYAEIVDVTVTNPDGHWAKLTKGFSFIAAAPPTIASISPATGTSMGGEAVTVRGTGFDFNTQVSFGGVPSPSVVAMDAMTLVASTPAHEPGVVDVAVTRADGGSATLAQSFTYTPDAASSSATTGTGMVPYDGPGNGCYCAEAGARNASRSAAGAWALAAGLAIVLSRRRR